MEREIAAGALIFRRDKGKPLFLFIYSGRNKIWGFPKGHLEQGETEKDAAVREIREETGIGDLCFLEGFREEEVYPAVSNRGPYNGTTIEKHSIYFLCETTAADIRVDNDEIVDYRWLSRSDGEKLLAFDSLKRILGKAEMFVRERSGV
jgi:tRNA nucleotidyltransferase (CCA-adding enzyme)